MTEQSLIANIDSSLENQIISMISNVIDELDLNHSNISSNADSPLRNPSEIEANINNNIMTYDNNNATAINDNSLNHLQLTNMNPTHIYYNNKQHNNLHYHNELFHQHLLQQHQFNQQQHNYQLHLSQQQHHNPFQNNVSLENQIFSEYECDLATKGGITEELFTKYKSSCLRLIRNQHTSRLSQIYLDNTPPQIIHKVFKVLLSFLPQLLLGIYSNYFCLKLYNTLSPFDQLLYIKAISFHFVDLCVDKISTYPIQCIIENANHSKQQQELIIHSIQSSRLFELCLDVYGTHVIEKVLTYFETSYTIYIVDFVLKHFLFLANNANGVCVVKKIIHLFSMQNKDILNKVQMLINENAFVLIQNPYGNHALQSAIDIWNVDMLAYVFAMLKGKLTMLSSQKYSSNVIEKCIEKSNEFLIMFIDEVISNEFSCLSMLLQNNYGNYVLQTTLRCCKDDNKKTELLNGIKVCIKMISDKKMISKWRNIIQSSVY